jgi:ferredoxin
LIIKSPAGFLIKQLEEIQLMKAIINKDICIGCTLCAQNCPGVFRMEGDKAVVFIDPVPADSEDCSRLAAESCPVSAIILEP